MLLFIIEGSNFTWKIACREGKDFQEFLHTSKFWYLASCEVASQEPFHFQLGKWVWHTKTSISIVRETYRISECVQVACYYLLTQD
jgi:hypothetical protein